MSYRSQIKFWLDLDTPAEAELNEHIAWWKNHRLWASTVRDALRLIADLRQGRTGVLLELFPWVSDVIADSRAGGNSGDSSATREQLARLESLLLSQHQGQVMAPVVSNGGPKPLAAAAGNKPAPPPYDDDLPALVVTRSKAAGNSAKAFLASAFAVAGMQ